MRRLGLLTMSLLIVIPRLASAQAFDLTGAWRDENGMPYTVRQVGGEVFWYMDGGARVRHVFHGTIAGNTIAGKWADLPTGELRNGGQLALRVESNDRMVKVGESQADHGSVWTRQAGAAPVATRRCWDWFAQFLDGRSPFTGLVTLDADGTATGSWGARGRWGTDASQRAYRIDWNRGAGREDDLVLSSDGRILEGRNFETRVVRGTLRPCPR